MRAALVALLLLAPRPAAAQDGLQVAGAALRDAAVVAAAGLDPGPLAVRVTAALASDAPDPPGLVSGVVGPTLETLSADGRFPSVHLAAFGRDGATPAAVARSLGYASLLDVTLRRDGPALVLEGSAVRTRDETRVSEPFAARVPLDAALRRHVGFPPLLADDAVTARSFPLPGLGYVALAVGDLDADGRAEIVAARPDEVHVLRVEGRRLTRVARAAFPRVPRSPTPPRRTVGTARVDGDRALVRVSDHAVGLSVRIEDGALRVELADGPCEADRFPMPGGCAHLVTGRDFFDPTLTHHTASVAAAPAHFYAYAWARYEARERGGADFEAIVLPSGRVSVRVRAEVAREGAAPQIEERAAAMLGYGTALAMGDLDLDGSAELLVSHASPPGTGDQLSLLRVLPRGTLRVMWRSERLPGSVWVAAGGDTDGDGAPELLAIEEPADGRGRAALWLVR